MLWSWPSWLAVALGVVAAALGFAWNGHADYGELAPSLLLGGLVLLAAGLHALQGAWSSCCDYGDGCDCDHCEGCRGDTCCGKCGCGPSGDGGHGPGDGHGH